MVVRRDGLKDFDPKELESLTDMANLQLVLSCFFFLIVLLLWLQKHVYVLFCLKAIHTFQTFQIWSSWLWKLWKKLVENSSN